MGFPAVIDKRAEREKYGETKKQKQFMLTESASHILDRLAFDRRVTRSEAIEQLIREEASKAFTFTVTRSVITTRTNNVNWAVTGTGTFPANA